MMDFYMIDKEKCKKYFRTVGEFTLHSYMEKFNDSEYTANKLLWDMVDKGVLEQTVGYLFRYIPQPGDEEEIKQEEEKGNTLYDELFGSKSETVDEDDEEDEGLEEDVDALVQYRRRLAEQRKIFGKHRLSDEDVKEDEEDFDDLECEEFGGSALENRKREILSKVARHLDGYPVFDRRCNAYVGSLGLTYPDDTPIKVKISYEDRIRMSDMGGTMAYMAKHFHMEIPQLSEGVKQVLSDYSLKLDEETQELSMVVQDAENARISFMCFFAAVERIVNLGSLNLARIVSDEVEERSKAEMKKILFNKDFDFEKAKAHAEKLLAQAKENGTDEDKIVFENVAKVFETVKAETYGQFVESIFWDEG